MIEFKIGQIWESYNGKQCFQIVYIRGEKVHYHWIDKIWRNPSFIGKINKIDLITILDSYILKEKYDGASIICSNCQQFCNQQCL